MLSGREPMAGDGGEQGEEEGDGRGGESCGWVGGGLLRRMGWVHGEMDGYARQEQAGLRVCVFVCMCVLWGRVIDVFLLGAGVGKRGGG